MLAGAVVLEQFLLGAYILRRDGVASERFQGIGCVFKCCHPMAVDRRHSIRTPPTPRSTPLKPSHLPWAPLLASCSSKAGCGLTVSSNPPPRLAAPFPSAHQPLIYRRRWLLASVPPIPLKHHHKPSTSIAHPQHVPYRTTRWIPACLVLSGVLCSSSWS